MYAGCWNFKTLKVSVAILNSIRRATEEKIRAPGQRRHGPSHIEQSRAHIMLTMLTLGALPGPAGPLKVAGPLGFCPPCPPSRRACQYERRLAANEACEALAKYDQIALLMDILCEQGNSEPPGVDLWKTLVVHSRVNYNNQVLI